MVNATEKSSKINTEEVAFMSCDKEPLVTFPAPCSGAEMSKVSCSRQKCDWQCLAGTCRAFSSVKFP